MTVIPVARTCPALSGRPAGVPQYRTDAVPEDENARSMRQERQQGRCQPPGRKAVPDVKLFRAIRRPARPSDAHFGGLDRLGADVLGEARLVGGELRRGLDGLVPRVRQVDPEIALDPPR